MKENTNEKKDKRLMIDRRDFLKGMGAMGIGLGMMPVLSLFGLESKAEEVATEAEKAADAAAAAAKSQFDYNLTANEEVCTCNVVYRHPLFRIFNG